MKKLIFVTSKYPFGSGETFIENEINYLAKAFDKVYIFAKDANEGEASRTVPENVVCFPANPKQPSKLDYVCALFKPSNVKEIFLHCIGRQMLKKISAVCYYSTNVRGCLAHARDFIKQCALTPEDDVTIYSYWLNTIGLCALKIKKELKKHFKIAKCVSRCHRFDIYADRTDINYLPFQKYLVKNFDEIYPCSMSGEDYLKERYHAQKDKIFVKYLGVKDRFASDLPKKQDVFNIVSCSYVVPVKRVHLIAKALSKIADKKISWTHFGDGELLEDVEKLSAQILPKNIKYEFKGRIPNNEIYDYYNNNNVNLLINVSSSEGLPVSIMEATSFGIPTIATNVGGTGEIVFDGHNGFLLEEDFKTRELAEKIVEFIDFSAKEYEEFCKNSREIFENSFIAEKAYNDFCSQALL